MAIKFSLTSFSLWYDISNPNSFSFFSQGLFLKHSTPLSHTPREWFQIFHISIHYHHLQRAFIEHSHVHVTCAGIYNSQESKPTFSGELASFKKDVSLQIAFFKIFPVIPSSFHLTHLIVGWFSKLSSNLRQAYLSHHSILDDWQSGDKIVDAH